MHKGFAVWWNSKHMLFAFVLAVLCLCVGETMRLASSEFADDPCSSVKRGTMVRAARALLSAVTRLLILADMADVMRLLAHLKIVCSLLIHFSLSIFPQLQLICEINQFICNLIIILFFICLLCHTSLLSTCHFKQITP